MSRRHKIEETENPLAKAITVSKRSDSLSFLAELISYSESKIHNIICKTFDGCSKIVADIVSRQ